MGITIGDCKLCKQNGRLLESHFIPQAAIRLLRGVISKNPNPTVLTPDSMVRSSFQVAGHVLCEKCEDRFSKGGETWVIPRIASKTGFPLLDAVRIAPMAHSIPGASLHACGGRSNIDLEKITYFAMSLFWRAAAHDWGRQSSKLELGPYEELIRQYLLGVAAFPRNMSLVVTLASDNKNVFTIIPPVPMEKNQYRSFLCYLPGVEFMLCVGNRVPWSMESCGITFTDGPIGISDGVAKRLDSVTFKMIQNGRGLTKFRNWMEREKKYGRG